MKIPGVRAAKTLSRWVKARLLSGALILGYHRVADVTRDEYEVCISPKHFAEQMEALSRYAQPISLGELVQCLKAGSVPPKAVAVTFDDGYADNLYEAKPVLEKHGILATVFICTGYVGKEFWWDELERLVACSRNDPRSLHLQSGGKQFQWKQMNPIPEAGQAPTDHEFRHRLYQFLLSLNPDDQNHALDIVRSWSDAPPNAISPSRALNREEITQLADGELVELGAHTRYHPMLPQLSFERQREEIESSKRDLEALLGKQIAGFAYPNGRTTGLTKRIVRELGFAYACTSLHDVVRPGSDMYELTRFWQQDVEGDTFLRGLHSWLRM